jgi:hypothetical protein
LIDICLRVDASSKVKMASTHSHTGTWTIHPPTIRKDMRQRALGSELAIALIMRRITSQLHAPEIEDEEGRKLLVSAAMRGEVGTRWIRLQVVPW